MSRMLEETREQPHALAKTLEEGAAALRDLRRHLEPTARLVVLVREALRTMPPSSAGT